MSLSVILVVVVTVVATEVVGAAQQAEGDAGADVGDDGQADEERLRERRLVDLAGEQEVRLGGGHGARGERDERGGCEVQAGEEREGVARVALDAYYCGASAACGLAFFFFFVFF